MVTFSICCTTYNHKDYIGQAIESFINQKTNFNFEIIIHDDASTDGTADIIREFERKNPKLIKAIYQKENQFTKGIKPFVEIVLPLTHGKYVAWCEGDDYWIDENKIQKQFDFLEAHPEVVIHSGHALVATPGVELGDLKVHETINSSRNYSLEDFTESNQLVTATCAFRNIPIPPLPEHWKKSSSGDWMLWIYLLKTTGLKAVYINEVFAVYRKHSGGMFGSLNQIEELEFFVKNMPLIIRQFEEQNYKNITRGKLNWYRTELFRKYLSLKKYVKAFKLWIQLLIGSTDTKTWMLLFEFKNSMLQKAND